MLPQFSVTYIDGLKNRHNAKQRETAVDLSERDDSHRSLRIKLAPRQIIMYFRNIWYQIITRKTHENQILAGASSTLKISMDRKHRYTKYDSVIR